MVDFALYVQQYQASHEISGGQVVEISPDLWLYSPGDSLWLVRLVERPYEHRFACAEVVYSSWGIALRWLQGSHTAHGALGIMNT